MRKLNKFTQPAKALPSIELKVVAIGNSRSVRLPNKRLTWEETYKEAAREREDWGGFDVALLDGLDPKGKW